MQRVSVCGYSGGINLRHRMIDGELLEFVFAQMVGCGIANVTDEELITNNLCDRERAAGSRKGVGFDAFFGDDAVDLDNEFAKVGAFFFRVNMGVSVFEQFNDTATGFGSAGKAAKTICYGIELMRVVDQECVFIRVTNFSSIC
jgi:hypothetical protein